MDYIDNENRADEISERLYALKELMIVEYFGMTQADDDLKVEYYSLNDELMKLQQSKKNIK